MARAETQRRYQRTEVRQAQILEAALGQLAEGGLASVTTRRIAARVGVTEPAIFRHFPDKAAIFMACLDHLEGLMFATPDEEPDSDPMVRLERFFRRRVALMTMPGSLGHLVFSEALVHATGEAGRERIAGWRRRSERVVLALLTELAKAGRLRADLPPRALVPVVQGQVLAFAVDRLVLGATSSSEATSLGSSTSRVDKAWALIDALLRPPASPTRGGHPRSR